MEELCKYCGKLLDQTDTIDREGGINEGYIIERQLWTCEHCQKDYIIEKQIYIKDEDVDIINFEEA